jgi:hypothetical protein
LKPAAANSAKSSARSAPVTAKYGVICLTLFMGAFQPISRGIRMSYDMARHEKIAMAKAALTQY